MTTAVSVSNFKNDKAGIKYVEYSINLFSCPHFHFYYSYNPVLLRLDCNVGRYSIILLSESWFDIARTYLHLLRLDMSPSHSSITNPPLHLPSRRCIDVSGSRSSFSILYFTSIFTVYNSSTLQNNILVKIDGVVYSYRVEIKNSYKYYIRNKLSLIY